MRDLHRIKIHATSADETAKLRPTRWHTGGQREDGAYTSYDLEPYICTKAPLVA